MVSVPTSELAETLTGKFILVFDDGEEVITNSKETIYSSFAWDYHRLYKELPLLKTHHVAHYLKKDEQGDYVSGNDTGTHIKLFNTIYWDLHALRNKDNPHNYDNDLSLQAFRGINNLYNYLSKLDEYVESFDILDYLAITELPEVKSYFETITPDHDGINGGYELLTNIIQSDERLNNNPLVRAARNKSIKHMQLLQVVGSRGKVTDIDSYQFDTPIVRGYIHGFKTIYDTLVESRPAAQSLFFNKDTLQNTEYFSRRLQIQSMIVERIHPGDCGSQNYISFRLRGENYDSHGRLTKKKDTHYFRGKYYLDEETNKLVELKETDEHLIGQRLKFRSPISGCFHPDPKGICSTCYGALSSSVPTDANIGHLNAAFLMEKISQSILSLKHYQGSALIDRIELDTLQSRFFTTNKSANVYLIKEQWKGKDLKMVIPKHEIVGITDLKLIEDVKKLGSITHFSEISNVTFIVKENNINDSTPVDIGMGRRKGSLTFTALNYIKQHGWDYDAKGNYVIDLKNWKPEDVLIKLPDIHVNASDLAREISSLIESKKSMLKSRDTIDAPSELLLDLHNCINNSLDINIALIEIIVFGSMIRDSSKNDFNLPKGDDRRGLGVSDITIVNRSLGAAMGYEDHTATIQSPSSYFHHGRPSHVMDVFVKPKESIEDSKLPRY
jgi:hypothetical protein